jgi:hypothetical protein
MSTLASSFCSSSVSFLSLALNIFLFFLSSFKFCSSDSSSLDESASPFPSAISSSSLSASAAAFSAFSFLLGFLGAASTSSSSDDSMTSSPLR